MSPTKYLPFITLVLLASFNLAVEKAIAQGTTLTVPSSEPAPDTADTRFLLASWRELSPAYSQDELSKSFAVGRFIGKLEERFQTPVPLFWQTTFLDINPIGITRKHPSRRMARTDANQPVKDVLASKKIKIFREGAVIEIELTAPIEKFLTNDRWGGFVTVAESESSYFIAKYAGGGFNSYELYGLDKVTGDEKWTTMVQPIDGVILGNGTSYHAAEVHASETSVVIFGASGMRHYLETFDPKTGQKTAGFNTTSK